MNFQKVNQYLSAHRFGRYLAATGNDFGKAESLYKASLKVAAAFHPLLGLLEVVLRNRVNDILAAHFNDAAWIIHQKAGFMAHPSLTYTDRRTGRLVTDDFLKTSVEASERRFRRLGIPIAASRIIAEQNLSFWTEIFEAKYYRLLQGRPIQIFQNLPSGYGRRKVADALNEARQFRNRINHNEPICFNRSNTIDFTSTENVYRTIKDIFAWIDPDLLTWTQDTNNVTQTISAAKAI